MLKLIGSASSGWWALGIAVLLLSVQPANAQACAAPANPIVAENCLTGNPSSEWDISGVGSTSIEGFTTDISVNRGGTIQFKIDSSQATAYRLDIYRSGYYGGNGARKVATVLPSVSLPQNQPNCLTNAATGLVDCGNWAVSASWAVPATAVSGVYFAKLTATAGLSGSSHIVFIVRDDSGASDILYQTSDTTWQAYNEWGGNSLYTGSPAGRAYKVSYNRPFATRIVGGGQDWYFANEYPMVRWLESNGYNISYTTGVDTDRRGAELLEHKIFLSVGHDEYWSGTQRANVEAAREQGVNLAFFSGNEVFWKTRWENSIDGSGTPYRTLVCYKETHGGVKIDPTAVWTGTFRDPRLSPPSDGGKPENALTGTLFMVNQTAQAIKVSEAEGKLRFWRNTAFANLSTGSTGTTTAGVIGYESDDAPFDASTPSGMMRLSTTVFNVASYLIDYGSNYGSGTSTHSLTLYKRPSGALVFGAGTIRWSWGLDGVHDLGGSVVDSKMQQATINLLADMKVQPATLRPGMVAASASTDTTPPVSVITSPASGASLTQAAQITITGTASDVGGRLVVVEVSTDGGTTWKRATGTSSWSFPWVASGSGTVNIKSRGVDDSGNFETTNAGVNVTFAVRTCPCTIFSTSSVPKTLSDPDSVPVEVGMKFTSSQAGTITGIRFYKGSQNTGTHTGSLWTAAGTRLATATFSGETASGWQQVNLTPPVAITASTVYVVSYFTPGGHYSADEPGLTSGVDSPPLRALADGESGGNGLYSYGASSFPNNTYKSGNYWVDVVFVPANSDTTPPTISSVSAAPNSTGAVITWTTNENSSSMVSYGTSAGSLTSSVSDPAMVTNHSITLTSLTPGTYYYRVTSADAASNSAASPVAPATLSFTVVDNIPPVISSVAAAPGSTSALISWNTNEPATTVVNWGTSAALLDQTSSSSSLTVPHSVSLSGLTVGTNYYYRVTSADASGNTTTTPIAANDPASFTTTVPAPPVISAITAAASNTTASISWTTDKASNSKVDYGTSPSALDLSATVATMVTAHTVPLSGLSAGVTYYFRVTSVEGTGLSVTSPNPPTAPASFTTSAAVGPTITALVAAPGLDGAARITWTTNVASNSVVQYGTSAATLNLTASNASLVTAHVVDLSGLAYGTTYYYRVTSVASAGGSTTSPGLAAAAATFSENLLSLFAPTAVPGLVSDSDTAAVVLGMKFKSDVPGYIKAIRFYKGAANTGSHTAKIYSPAGTALSSVTFAGETASGWQQQNLTTPLAITANTTYVVSYRAPVGRYSSDNNFFTNGVDRGTLHAPSSSASGGNGVYKYGAATVFPNLTFQDSNYWVDIVFSTTP
ncbi:MAG: N,N-dimethylformamidase beta subunit family domain-containing protein [Bryobacteraceae bacterium]